MDIIEDKPGEQILLLGNEAITRGALEAGVDVATTYPGTPSSEIADTFSLIARYFTKKKNYVKIVLLQRARPVVTPFCILVNATAN